MKKSTMLALVAGLLAAPAAVQAQSLSFPVPANAFIVFGGLNWAWASPCNGGCSNPILGDGWRYATTAEWAARPSYTDFLNPNGNHAGAGGQMACAASYFDPIYDHCDWNDAVQGYIASGPGNVGPLQDPNSETWLVQAPQNVVPEPSSVAMFGAGALVLGVMARRRRQTA